MGGAFGFTVKASWRIPAQTAGGTTTGEAGAGGSKQVTVGCDEVASAPRMAFCAAVARKILVSVNSGTAFCASCRKPSNATNRNVLSFLIGKPRVPPNCWRLKVSLIGEPKVSGLAGLKAWPACNAWLKEKGFWASITSLRKKPYRPPCKLLVPDLVTILMEAPVAAPRSA